MMEKCVSASLFLSSGEIHRWGKGESKWKETGLWFCEYFFTGFGLQNIAKLSRTRCTDIKRRGDKCAGYSFTAQTLQSCNVALMPFTSNARMFSNTQVFIGSLFRLPISDLNLACSHFLLAQRQEATSQRLRVRWNTSSGWCEGVTLIGTILGPVSPLSC